MTDKITLAGILTAALAYLGILLLAFPIHTEAMGYPYSSYSSYGYDNYYYPQTQYYYSYPQYYYYPYYYDISYSYPYYYDYSYYYYDFYDPYYYGGYGWF